MEYQSDWKRDFEQEIKTAKAARQRGSEGMARVCARRAAGIVAGEYFRRQGIECRSKSAYELLKMLESHPNLPARVRETAGHFLLRLTPSHELPISVDLLSEAGWLSDTLLSMPGVQAE